MRLTPTDVTGAIRPVYGTGEKANFELSWGTILFAAFFGLLLTAIGHGAVPGSISSYPAIGHGAVPGSISSYPAIGHGAVPGSISSYPAAVKPESISSYPAIGHGAVPGSISSYPAK